MLHTGFPCDGVITRRDVGFGTPRGLFVHQRCRVATQAQGGRLLSERGWEATVTAPL